MEHRRSRARAARFIPEVHEFCDGWCERCPLCDRCEAFSERPDRSVPPTLLPPAPEEGVPTLDELIELAPAPTRGILRRARDYTLGTLHVLEQERSGVAERRAALGNVGQRHFDDALRVITRYATKILSKLGRAAGLESAPFSRLSECEIQRDADGSAKVALLSMDQSQSAWCRLRALGLPDNEAIAELRRQLVQLRGLTEATFPRARDFCRPGFDDESGA